MRMLVYGFRPYKSFRENITEKIIEALPAHPELTKTIFPVRFERRQFVHALKEHGPDTVIGLGQCTRRRIALECRATNLKRSRATGPQRAIRRNGPPWLDTTLHLRTGAPVGISHDAGDYVCNFSMYVMLEYIARKTPGVGFAFMHIPHDCALEQATRVVAGLIRDCSEPENPFTVKTRPGSKVDPPSPA